MHEKHPNPGMGGPTHPGAGCVWFLSGPARGCTRLFVFGGAMRGCCVAFRCGMQMHPESGCGGEKRRPASPFRMQAPGGRPRRPPARPLLASECGMRARAHSGASGCEIGFCIQAGDAERKNTTIPVGCPHPVPKIQPGHFSKTKTRLRRRKKARQNAPQIAVPKGTGNRPRGAARLQCVSSAVRPAAHASRPVEKKKLHLHNAHA